MQMARFLMVWAGLTLLMLLIVAGEPWRWPQGGRFVFETNSEPVRKDSFFSIKSQRRPSDQLRVRP